MIYSILLAILLVALVLLLAWQLLRWLPAGADGLKPLPYVIALLPIAPFCAGFGLIASIVSAIATRSQNGFYKSYVFLCVAYIVLFVISLKSYSPYFSRRLREQTQEKSQTRSQEKSLEIRVMTLNCRYGRANASQIIKLAKTHKIDTILLQEVSKKLVKNLEKLGIKRDFAHVQLGNTNNHENGGFNAIYTRLSNVKSFGKSIKIDAANVPIVTAVSGDSRAENLLITFASAHPKSPMRGCAAWCSGIMALAKIGENHNKSGYKKVTIIGGDLNSTPDHPSFRTLLKSGFLDASMQIGKRLKTWPTWQKWPNLALDHVLVKSTGCSAKATEQSTIRVDGSDHFALIVCVSIPL
ncbi:endonuclease/exonuclease/phosphatase family protein [Gardnerella pickettii]|uniref:endonuclease/exonuclease/phosphatase family protein n=1 Tax=Gardnerella pickettii TaxID=2914924 RepID=UPI000763D18F|nr:endonuclease/exonuclease/phosphatase family protein [Gardnerella pickettii]MDK7784798.1 endonuclease/exonuclease/phosphatase family protein [Bifidobacterium sp. UMB6791B]MDK8249363.1 endonuclease/exonuclease/phosphatase family protein [Bifidobacterium sp. UMB6794B]MDK8635174.1 endonuclease/exonuclease/phosphatase family protein [Bifidobacterium sp. UMB6791A]KXA16381.1 endonuclease/exonuclease/phosphatase family protein [Gardnerella pickettii]MDF2278347.1 endonuclease/exonuclease/phosphatase